MIATPPSRQLTLRWVKFNAVGLIGVAVQLSALAFLQRVAGIGYLLATALAVECAILHNFLWHERWTWRDRPGAGSAFARLLRFNLGAGLVSIACNLVMMRVLVGVYHAPLLPANLLAIAVGSIANFLVSDRLVFRKAPAGPKDNT